jgi:hypothetical protein
MVTNSKGINIPRKLKGKWSNWNKFELFLLQYAGVMAVYVDLCNKCRKEGETK